MNDITAAATMRFLTKFSDIEGRLMPSIIRLTTGNLIKSIQTDMQTSLSSKNPLKLKVYSAHDSQVTALLVAFHRFDFRIPSYASALVFELYDDTSVALKYRTHFKSEFTKLGLCKG